jgi:transketolase
MAIAERILAARFGGDLVDHRTYVIAGDGCLMEGISHEAISLAGHLKLSRLIVLFDDNNVSIDGPTSLAVSDDQPARFRSCGWSVESVDGHDPDVVAAALQRAQSADRPSLIACRTVIGYGAPKKAGTAATHGAPLGAEEVAAARVALGWSHPPFVVPEAVYRGWDAREDGKRRERKWNKILKGYKAAHPEEAAEFERRVAGQLPADFEARVQAVISDFSAKGETLATRRASQLVLDALVPALPELVGGSADLTGSNLTMAKASKAVGRDGSGNHVFYGVREFGMCAVMNGLALHGGVIPYGGTFLVFSDYARNALRLATLMGVQAIYVFTHDSIGLGEDGPTHQPVEHAATLRLMPNMEVWRPCDTVETAVAWAAALGRKNGPTALLLTRQNVPFMQRKAPAEVGKGGYVLSDAANARAVIIATGSEVSLAMGAQKLLGEAGIPVRVVSMPSTTEFDRQPKEYRNSVLPPQLPKVAVEAGVSDFWRKYVGTEGAVVGLDRYGESAPAADVFKHFGFTTENVAKAVRSILQ